MLYIQTIYILYIVQLEYQENEEEVTVLGDELIEIKDIKIK